MNQPDTAPAPQDGWPKSRNYNVGVQPCNNFASDFITPFGNPLPHECIYCKTREGVVSFCSNCHSDHHDGGLETCEHNGCNCNPPYKLKEPSNV
jgi:hypothetical protein